MPLPKPIYPSDEEPLSFINRALDAVSGFWGRQSSDHDDVPHVGKYKADYSELTPQQIAADAGCKDLFEHSDEKPVS
jgi:hypothetical protein